MKSDLLDLTLVEHHRTEKAVLVSDTGEESKAIWLPLSRVEIEDAKKTVRGMLKNGQVCTLPLVTVTLPERLAIEKGLV
jgi:hypothetical protein